MADGLFYHDTRPPFVITDPSSVTLSTTDKALYLKDHFPVLGSNYWWAGKKVMLRVFGRTTTAATPGNYTWSLYWGTGADANGTVISAGKTVAATASQTNLCWEARIVVTCRAIGASGTLLATGFVLADSAVIANGYVPLPSSAPAATTVDLTAANILSLQLKRSGSTAETAQVHEIEYCPLN